MGAVPCVSDFLSLPKLVQVFDVTETSSLLFCLLLVNLDFYTDPIEIHRVTPSFLLHLLLTLLISVYLTSTLVTIYISFPTSFRLRESKNFMTLPTTAECTCFWGEKWAFVSVLIMFVGRRRSHRGERGKKLCDGFVPGSVIKMLSSVFY